MPYDPVKYGDQYDAILEVVRQWGDATERDMRDDIEEAAGIKRVTIGYRLNELVEAGKLNAADTFGGARKCRVFSVPECDDGEFSPADWIDKAEKALPGYNLTGQNRFVQAGILNVIDGAMTLQQLQSKLYGTKRSELEDALSALINQRLLQKIDAFYGLLKPIGSAAPLAAPKPTQSTIHLSQPTDENIERLKALYESLSSNELAVLNAFDFDGNRAPYTAAEILREVYPGIRSETTVRKLLAKLTSDGFLEHWHCDDGLGCGLARDDQYLWCLSEAFDLANSEVEKGDASPVEAAQPAPAPKAPAERVVAAGEPQSPPEAPQIDAVAAMIQSLISEATRRERERADLAEARVAELEGKLAKARELMAVLS